ncbi:unnamed protein product [Rotaria sp. Silwood2]|nr:unnamed protein product [Rotaria sp. Silwood2]CAF2770797.1 unnamed protein product [Rotaria sp. Silwood2]CAF3016072.1 unnamed protein product [Rotaria sp. Silwood2]CAF3160545.1 unnamed protein product [Rotaria sp. Silwood2]CAF3909694.1 unnamed protein product [Rotaria sp. Silwood2]
MDQVIVYFILILCLFQSSQSNNNKNNNIAYNIPDPDCTGVFNLCTDADKERLGRQAIKSIHEQMDDDKDGLIEASESRDFIHEELESKTDSVRHRRFQNDDLQITFDDLWTQWKNNPVYNWSNDDVIHWVVNHVHLSIYVEYFRRNQIDGRMIPRLAANEKQYISTIMQIRDPRHKRRLIIKATDVVLFGPPQQTHRLIKDMILISALLISVAACLYAFIRHRKTQESMNNLLKELETLQKAEGDLIAVTGKVKAMENELQEKPKVDRGLLNSWFIEVQRTKEEADKYRKRRDTTIDNDKQLRLAVQEIEQLRIALRKAEEHARHQSYEAPPELIDLLKRTYHIEEAAFEIKRKTAESAMLTAKEQMNKISKMQKGFFGAVRIAHTGCMDNISELINAAKERLAEVHDEYEEREHRWNKIASLLDRNDLVCTSAITNDSSSWSKPTSIESTGLLNSNNDSTPIGKPNSNFNSRGLSANSQQDTISQIDNGFELTNSPSAILKNRFVTNRRPSNEYQSSNSPILYSKSSNCLNDLNRNSTVFHRPNTYESFEKSLASKSAKTSSEGVPDRQISNNDSMFDDQNQQSDGHSQLINSSTDDRRSLSSFEKTRKQLISTKFLKSFQNMRFRKKLSTS